MLKKNIFNNAYLNTIKEDQSSNISDVEKCQMIAEEIGGTYDIETNTIDCNYQRFKFENKWLNDNGSFDFKLTNLNEDCCAMFFNCTSLTHLPEDFTIPPNATICSWMFYNCKSLKYLPDNFNLPETITNCESMFKDCESLTKLPERFKLPENVDWCAEMFSGCISLTELPEHFHLPLNNDIYTRDMFKGCVKLQNQDPQFYVEINI